MSGSGDIKSRESSIITFQIPSDMGFVRKTKKQKIINIRSNSKKGAIPMIPEWLAFWKEFIPSPLSHRCIIKTASAPTHPQKQTNKQNLSCCLLYCNFYSDLEFSFYRLINTTDFFFFEVPLKMFYAHKKDGCDCYLPKGTCLGALLLNTTMMGYVS